MIPVNTPAAGAPRANAISNVRATVTVDTATTDLREIRAAVKQSLIRHREVGDEERAVNALVPLLPKRLLRGASSARRASNVVASSNLGVVNPPASRPDVPDRHYVPVKSTI